MQAFVFSATRNKPRNKAGWAPLIEVRQDLFYGRRLYNAEVRLTEQDSNSRRSRTHPLLGTNPKIRGGLKK